MNTKTEYTYQTLGDAFPLECERVRELLVEYERLGVAGAFGAAGLRVALNRADIAMVSGDLSKMISAYCELRNCE